MNAYSADYLKEYDVFERSFSTKTNPDAKKDRDALARRKRKEGWEIKTEKVEFPDMGSGTLYTIEGRKKKPLPPPDDGRAWEPFNRDLVKGDILKVLIDDSHPEKGWLYAYCTGGGFGCTRASLGHAIFVIESLSLQDVEDYAQGMKEGMVNESTAMLGMNRCRWESNWGIYIKKQIRKTPDGVLGNEFEMGRDIDYSHTRMV
jgi:hypothetical protein